MKFIIGLTILTISAIRAEIPSNFPKCKNGDAGCLAKSANEILPKYYAGQKDVNLLPYDPLHIKSLKLNTNPSSPVNMAINFSDLDLIGLKNMKVSSFVGLKADLSGRNVFEASIPEVIMKGQYNVEGRVLVLPITGDGQAEIKLKGLRIKYSFDFKSVQKNDKTYAELEHVKLDLEPELVQFKLDNLFNGDKVLGDNMNVLLNENWQEVYRELKPSMTKTVSLIIKSLCNSFFEKHPYADYFE